MNTGTRQLSLLQQLIRWREEHISEKRFVLLLSFLVGIFTALAAWVLKMLIHQIEAFLTETYEVTQESGLYRI